MDINIDRKRKEQPDGLKILHGKNSFSSVNDINVEISKKQLSELKKNNFELKVAHINKRKRFVKKLDTTKKLFSSVLSPTILVASYIQKVLKNFAKIPVISSAIIVSSQNAVYAVSDGIDIIQRFITMPSNIRSKHRMQKIQKSFFKDFNKFYGYDWLKKDATNNQLRNERQKVLTQIDSIHVFKTQLKLKEKPPKLGEDLKYANMLLHQKKEELRHINEYMAISNSLNIEKNRIHDTLIQISYSTVSFTARATISVLSALCSTNPIINQASSLLLYNNLSRYMLSFNVGIKQFFRNIAHQRIKREQAKNLMDLVTDIASNTIDKELVYKSRLGSKPLLQRDFNKLLILKNQLSSNSYIELDQNIHKALSKIGKEFLSLKDVETISNFISSIEHNDSMLSPQDALFIGDLRKSINNYHEALFTYDLETIKYQNDIYNAKANLSLAFKKNAHLLNTNQSWLVKLLNNQYFSDETMFNISVFDYFYNSKNLSPEFKRKLINSENMQDNAIWKSFNPDKSTISQKSENENTADFIINMVSSLPARKYLIKNNVEISINDLDLNNENDRILLNEVYQNWAEYEHAKIFIKACFAGNNTKSSAKIIEQIRAISNDTDRNLVKDLIVKELAK